MKKTLVALSVSALVAVSSVTAFAAGGKDACMLNAENCTARSMSITEIIAKLKTEISKGRAVYTAEELKILHSKLSEYQYFLEKMQQS